MTEKEISVAVMGMTQDERREYEALDEKKKKVEADSPIIIGALVVIIITAVIIGCAGLVNPKGDGGANVFGGFLVAVVCVILIFGQTAKKNGLQDQVAALLKQQAGRRGLMQKILAEAGESGFEPSVTVADTTNTRCIAADETHKRFLLKAARGNSYSVYDYADLIDFSLSQDGSTLITGNSGDALLGSLFMGTAGAVIGAAGPREIREICSKMYIEIVLNDIQNPRVVLTLIETEMPKSSPDYKYITERAKEMIALLQLIRNNTPDPVKQERRAISVEADEAQIISENTIEFTRPKTSTPSFDSSVEQVRAYKALLDEGLISQEEYDAKRKELLNL